MTLNDPFTITDPVILEELEAITDEEERAQAKTNALWQRVWRNKAGCRIHTFPALCSK